MLGLADVRKYISELGIAEDGNVYIGKLDNKQEKSIGVYHRKAEEPPRIPLGGMKKSSYGTYRISLLVHWNKRVTEAEKAAYELYEKLLRESRVTVGGIECFLELKLSEPVDIGTDDNGIYEYVIWVDFIYMRK